jgi:S1-C subfamily serine protease
MRYFLYLVLCTSLLSAASCGDGVQQSDQQAAPQVAQPELPPPVARALTAREIATRSFPSVVLLSMSDANGQPISLGSGFFVGYDIVATNAHVIEGARSGLAKRISQTATMRVLDIAGIDAARDIALLRVEGQGPALALTDSASVGETVYAIGNPEGLEGTFSQGIVSGIRAVGDYRFLQITAPISPGSSGGPVLNERGEAIGVATATYRGGQNLNFALPAEYVRELLSSPLSNIPLEDGPRRPRSLTTQIGERATAGVVGENFQWNSDYDFEGGGFTLSLRNQLDRPIKDVNALVVFHDRQGRPIEVARVTLYGVIPPGLARRASGTVHSSIMRLTTPENRQYGTAFARAPTTRLDVRTLGFNFAE